MAGWDIDSGWSYTKRDNDNTIVDRNVSVSLLIQSWPLFITSALAELLVLSCYCINRVSHREQYFTS